MTIAQTVTLFFLSGFASIDRLAGFNIMLSRPFVVAGIVGYMFDNIIACLLIGIIFELIGMLEVPVGTTIPKDDTFGSYAVSVLISVIPTLDNAISLLICIAVTILFMYPVTFTDKYCRNINKKLISFSIKSDKKDYESDLIEYGLLIAFIRGVLVYNVAVLIMGYAIYNLKYINITYYSPYFLILLIYAFLAGYLFKFFSINKFFKTIVFALGLIVGWIII